VRGERVSEGGLLSYKRALRTLMLWASALRALRSVFSSAAACLMAAASSFSSFLASVW
jgi:hypothetical protein